MLKQPELFIIPNTLDKTSGYLGVQAYELHPDDLSNGIASNDVARVRRELAELQQDAKEATPQEQIGNNASRLVLYRESMLDAIIPLDAAA